MSIESILAFSVAMLVLAITPGPGVFASVAQALSSGFRSSMEVIAGIVLGDILYLMFAIFGLSAIAQAFGELFFVVRLLGGGYLIWMGWKMWTSEPVPFNANRKIKHRSGGQRFIGGLFITLGNPKVILFYVGFLPTFIDLASLTVADTAIIAGIVTMVLVGVMGVYCYSAASARRLFVSRRATRNLNRSAGTVMIGTGIVIATR